jgi:hypothetical protein
VLVNTFEPKAYAVQIFNGDRPILAERCDDPEDAAALAERLWTMFVDDSST